MKLDDFNRLKKIMARTFSDNDPEALASIRAANVILSKDSLTWDRVLDRVVHVEPDVEEAPASAANTMSENRRAARNQQDREIEEAFEVLEGADLGDFADFVNSLRMQWNSRRFLSPRQIEALTKAVRRENDRREAALRR